MESVPQAPRCSALLALSLPGVHTVKTKPRSRHRKTQHMLCVGVYFPPYRAWLCASRERAGKQQSFPSLFLSGWQKGLRDNAACRRLEAEWGALLNLGFPCDPEPPGPELLTLCLSPCRAMGVGSSRAARPPGFPSHACLPGTSGGLGGFHLSVISGYSTIL